MPHSSFPHSDPFPLAHFHQAFREDAHVLRVNSYRRSTEGSFVFASTARHRPASRRIIPAATISRPASFLDDQQFTWTDNRQPSSRRARPRCSILHPGTNIHPQPWHHNHKTHTSTMRRTAGMDAPSHLTDSHPCRPFDQGRPRLFQPANSTCHSPLCIEEFDLSDRNFRPCPCGYQVRYRALSH